MLCDKCHKRQAKIYCTEIVNGKKKEQYLCETCAAQYTSFQMNKFNGNREMSARILLSDLLEKSYENQKKKLEEMPKCPSCGMDYNEFLDKGRFGCAQCYHAFGKVFDRSLEQIQGSEIHRGKIPKGFLTSADKAIQSISEIEKLTLKLQYAVEKEEFEEAARLRDLIRALKKKQESSKSQEEISNA